MGDPSHSTLPRSGVSVPRTTRIVVVLPAPLLPTKPNTSPGSSWRLRSSTATRSPNRFVMPCSSKRASATNQVWMADEARLFRGLRCRQYDCGVAGLTLLDVLQHGSPTDPAIAVPDGVRLNYRELREQVDAAAGYLAQLGVGRGDRVALVLPNSVEAIVLFLAASIAGTAAPLNAAYKEEEFRFYLQDTGASVLVVPPGQGEAARRAMPAGTRLVEAHMDGQGRLAMESEAPLDRSRTAGSPGDDDVALVLHTSGTTNRPKLVPLRHRNLFASAGNIATTYALTPNDIAFCVMPLFHIHGLMASTMATFWSGGLVVVPPRFDPMTFWPALHQHGATWYSAVPTMHQMLLMRNRGER